jgi:hypothetical protein
MLRTTVLAYVCPNGGISYFKKRIPEELQEHYKFPKNKFLKVPKK